MAVCHSRCQVVSLDCSQSLTERKLHPSSDPAGEENVVCFMTFTWKNRKKKVISDFCTGIKPLCIDRHNIDVWYCTSLCMWCRQWITCTLQSLFFFLYIFSLSSLWFCCIGFSVCNFTRLMTLSHTCKASLTKIQQHNVHSIFVSYFPFKKHSNQH